MLLIPRSHVENPEKAREARWRRAARREGHVLRKSRCRVPGAAEAGLWRLVDADLNVVVAETYDPGDWYPGA